MSLTFPSPTHLDTDESRALVVGDVAVERVKSLVAVMHGVDDTAAERLLQDVAYRADLPLWAASDQVLDVVTTLVARAGLTPEVLDAALASVAPARRLHHPAA
ncbi:MAG TPA: hypothetical protein VKY86_20545 [Promicromonospora sp.]|nr:hypothetical protein [Promicromonospora sp.]